MAFSAAAGAAIPLTGALPAAADDEEDLYHPAHQRHALELYRDGPAADYTPFTLNDDTTRGGFARLAG